MRSEGWAAQKRKENVEGNAAKTKGRRRRRGKGDLGVADMKVVVLGKEGSKSGRGERVYLEKALNDLTTWT